MPDNYTMNSNPQPFQNIRPPPSGSRPSSANSLVSRLTTAIILLLVTLVTVIGIAWLVMNPHAPDFRVTSLSVSNFTVSNSRSTGNYNLGVTIKNPNKKIKVSLDDFNIWVCYDEVVLSVASVKPIYLEKMTERDLNVDQFVVKESLSKLYGNLGKHWSKGSGVVYFNVKMQVRTKYEAGNWPSNLKLLRVLCIDLDVFFPEKVKGTGKLGNSKGFEKKDCEVHSTTTTQ